MVKYAQNPGGSKCSPLLPPADAHVHVPIHLLPINLSTYLSTYLAIYLPAYPLTYAYIHNTCIHSYLYPHIHSCINTSHTFIHACLLTYTHTHTYICTLLPCAIGSWSSTAVATVLTSLLHCFLSVVTALSFMSHICSDIHIYTHK